VSVGASWIPARSDRENSLVLSGHGENTFASPCETETAEALRSPRRTLSRSTHTCRGSSEVGPGQLAEFLSESMETTAKIDPIWRFSRPRRWFCERKPIYRDAGNRLGFSFCAARGQLSAAWGSAVECRSKVPPALQGSAQDHTARSPDVNRSELMADRCVLKAFHRHRADSHAPHLDTCLHSWAPNNAHFAP